MTETSTNPPEESYEPGSAGEETRSDVAAEFLELGKNLKNILQSVWESEERRRLQQEIELGMAELGRSLSQTVEEFRESPTGQRLRTDADELRARIRSGEMEVQLREELLSILRRVNAELDKAAGRASTAEKAETDRAEEV